MRFPGRLAALVLLGASSACGPPAVFPGVEPPPEGALDAVEVLPSDDLYTTVTDAALDREGRATLVVSREPWDGSLPRGFHANTLVRLDAAGRVTAERDRGEGPPELWRFAAGADGTTVLATSCASPSVGPERVVRLVASTRLYGEEVCTRVVRLDASLSPLGDVLLEGLRVTALAAGPGGEVAVAGIAPRQDRSGEDQAVVLRLDAAGEVLARVAIERVDALRPGELTGLHVHGVELTEAGSMAFALQADAWGPLRVGGQLVTLPAGGDAWVIAHVRSDGALAGARALGSAEAAWDSRHRIPIVALPNGDLALHLMWYARTRPIVAKTIDVGLGPLPLDDDGHAGAFVQVGAGAGAPSSAWAASLLGASTSVASLIALPNGDVAVAFVSSEADEALRGVRCDGERLCEWKNGPRAVGYRETLEVQRIEPRTGQVKARAGIPIDGEVGVVELGWVPRERSLRVFVEVAGSALLHGRGFVSPVHTYDPCPNGVPREESRRPDPRFFATIPLPDPCTRSRYLVPRRILARVDLR